MGDKNKFMAEVNILKSMDHPNILKLFEVFEDTK
jgi:serine/threonine protein kinase